VIGNDREVIGVITGVFATDHWSWPPIVLLGAERLLSAAVLLILPYVTALGLHKGRPVTHDDDGI
jgi:hypothetical protein